MRVVVAGGHGQIGLRLLRRLAAGGHRGVGIVRNPDHVDDVEATGAEAVVCDLERTTVDRVVGLLAGAGAGAGAGAEGSGDAVVFAAGAGPGSGAARKDTVDRAASVLLADAAVQAGVPRFLQISSMGAGAPPRPGTDEVFAAYLVAKTAAEEDLRRRPLDWTVVRPGRLTNDPGTGRVRLAPPPVPRGAVSRDDVADVLVALLATGRGSRATVELVRGTTPIDEAVAAL